MKLSNKLNTARALALLACLLCCPLAASAQENANTNSATQNSQSNRSSQTTRSTTTTTTTTAPTPATQAQPAQTTTVAVSRNINGVAGEGPGGISPIWLILGAVALLAILLIVILSARGRSSGTRTETVRETTIKKD